MSLEIEHLGKSFSSKGGVRVVLRNFTLTVPEKQFLCILGPSGCGKSTLIRIVAGISKPSAGRMVLDGCPLNGPGADRALVFQNYGLLPWRNVQRNVELGLEIQGVSKAQRREMARYYLEVVGLTGNEQVYPHQLSGGMQQRVGLARALAKRPRILLMDEPFAAVDMQTRERLQEELLSIWQQHQSTVIFVTHSIEEAIVLGDRVVVMGSGTTGVVDDVPVTFERPRDSTRVRATGNFAELAHRLREKLRGASPAPEAGTHPQTPATTLGKQLPTQTSTAAGTFSDITGRSLPG